MRRPSGLRSPRPAPFHWALNIAKEDNTRLLSFTFRPMNVVSSKMTACRRASYGAVDQLQ